MSQRYSESLLLHHARTFDTLPRTANPEFTAAREAMMKTTGNRGSMENLPDHLTDHLTIPLRTAATVPTTPTQEMHFPSIDSQLSPNTASPRKDDDYPAPLKVPPTPPKIPSTPLDIPSTPPKHQRLPEKDDPFSHSVDMCLAQARIIEDQDDGLKQAILRNAFFLFESNEPREINIAVGTSDAITSMPVFAHAIQSSPYRGQYFAIIFASEPRRFVAGGARRSCRVLMQSPKRCQSRRRALEGLLVATEEAVGFKVFGAATPNGDTSDEKKSAGGEKRSGAGEVGLNIGLDGEAER